MVELTSKSPQEDEQCSVMKQFTKCVSCLLQEALSITQYCRLAVAYCAFTLYTVTFGRRLLFDGQHKVCTRMQWDEQQSSQNQKQITRSILF